MTTPTDTFLDTLDEVERQLRLTATWVAEMSMQDSEMQAHVRRWTLFAPPDRYEKRVGKADAFFGPMDWHEITAFAQRSKQEWVYDPWNFFFMLEHLSDRFPAQLEICERVNHQLLLAATKLRAMLGRGIPDSDAKFYLTALQAQMPRFIEMVEDTQAAVGQQLRKAIEVSQQLEKMGMIGKRSTLLDRSMPA